MHSATLTTLDLVESVMADGMTLTKALSGVREEVPHMLGVPAEYGLLVEAEAAAQIVEAASLPVGSPFGPAIGQGLARIEEQPIEEQEQFVRTAARRYALTTPPRPRSVPALLPPARTPGRAR
ncbi:hypothetical protein ACFYN0_01090 [Streptomyces sp. NPDC006704]|uniref:hypothetical protein n=1 Tax=Streptomyces sp. NPDC006704 TaxID=3364760 RepID=UPI0036C2ECD4